MLAKHTIEIFIAGQTGSGKSRLARILQNNLEKMTKGEFHVSVGEYPVKTTDVPFSARVVSGPIIGMLVDVNTDVQRQWSDGTPVHTDADYQG